MSLNLNRMITQMDVPQQIIILKFDPLNGVVHKKEKKLVSVELFANGTFIARDANGIEYTSDNFVADTDGFEIFGDWSVPVVCWTTRKTLYKKIYKNYIEVMNSHLVEEEKKVLG